MWKNIQSAGAGTLYDMLDGQLKTWQDYFDAIGDIFKRMLANMGSAFLSAEIASWFTGKEFRVNYITL